MSTITAYELQAGAQAVQDVCTEMLEAAGAAMTRHGPDPNSAAILGAAFAMAADKITNNIDPNFKRRLVILLGGDLD